MTTVSSHRIEVLENGPDAELGERLVAFWTSSGALDEASARARLPRVLCVIFDSEDEVAGVNSVYQDTAPLIQRRFWMYRRFVRPSVPREVETEMLKAASDELARRFAETAEGPVGVCVLVSDPAVIEREREAVWTSGFVYAGYTEAGAQVRVRYFVGAGI